MADNLVLKIRSKKGCIVLDQLAANATAATFLGCVSQMTGIPYNRIKILNGFPRKLIEVRNHNQTLNDLGFSTGDMLIIEENDYIPTDNSVEHTVNRSDEFRIVFTLGDLEFLQFFIPGNNSCLFASVQFAISGGKRSQEDMANASKKLRKIVADVIRSNPDTYTDAILGMANTGYQEWITNEDNWGGAIELAILSQYFKVEIVLINTATQHLHCFGENEKHGQRIFLIYNGVHYDGFARRSKLVHQSLKTLFSMDDDQVTNVAVAVAKTLKAKFETLNGQMSYVCSVCKISFNNHPDLIAHAEVTKHSHYQQH